MISLKGILGSIVFICISIFTFITLDKYVGSSLVYLLFSFVSTLFLFYGFRQNAIFFDTFIGVFLWLGFWLKISYTIAYLNSNFAEGLNGIKIPANVFDEALLIASSVFIIIMIASYIRERYIFKYPKEVSSSVSGLFLFYKYHRKKILFFYIILFIFIAISNFYLGIYQRGELTQTYLPFGLNGVYKWLLLFGLASFAAVILKYEFDLNKKTKYFVPILTLIEASITNISLLSRGMILNVSALGYGMLHYLNSVKIKINLRFLIILIFTAIILFIVSVKVINNIRANSMYSKDESIVKDIVTTQIITGPIGLILNRGVGSEGLISILMHPNRGWELFNDAMSEKAGEYPTSFYDVHIIDSPYKNKDMSNHHYTSLPGFIAFFYYSGSLLFLFTMVFLLTIFASIIEYLAYKSDKNNLILAALIAQVIAYRYTHFGYAPAQSYLLFGAIVLNILIVYMLDRMLSIVYKEDLDEKT